MCLSVACLTYSPGIQIVQQDDHLPMQVDTELQVNTVLDVVWVTEQEKIETQQYVFHFLSALLSNRESCRSALPLNLPWSQTFYLCCQDVRHTFYDVRSLIDSSTDSWIHPKVLCIR